MSARKELKKNSQLIVDAATRQIKALQEGMGAIRDVLLDGNQAIYVEIYRQADRPQRILSAKNKFIGSFLDLRSRLLVWLLLLFWVDCL